MRWVRSLTNYCPVQTSPHNSVVVYCVPYSFDFFVGNVRLRAKRRRASAESRPVFLETRPTAAIDTPLCQSRCRDSMDLAAMSIPVYGQRGLGRRPSSCGSSVRHRRLSTSDIRRQYQVSVSLNTLGAHRKNLKDSHLGMPIRSTFSCRHNSSIICPLRSTIYDTLYL